MYTSIVHRVRHFVVLDLIAIVLLYLIPTLSHVTSFPLYRFEPMRCVLLFNLLLSGDRKNSYLMAVTLPLFSFFVGSHPVFVKALIISAELLVNVFLYYKLFNWLKNASIAMFLAIMLSKVFYYILKYICITGGLLSTNVVDTSFIIQIAIAIMISLFFLVRTKE